MRSDGFARRSDAGEAGRSCRDRKALRTAYVTSTRALLRVISADAFIRGATLTSFSYLLAVTLGRMKLVVMGRSTTPTSPEECLINGSGP
ncbi:hypothetical protein DIZ27_44890 [Streptomyces sp. NWU339]|uniref:hypothetical protein n=1 Tax=Streptomyces sp. NWU339 TaxID=2185284 RepID=UPI000D674463|nr:hypothetical protein [Streptomyces sp. NWU339]PWI04516.1 hypothetical protein DIZ27_44890 [Streptomyces sp. NWU339]